MNSNLSRYSSLKREANLKSEGRESFTRRRALISKEVKKNKRRSIISQAPKSKDFFRKIAHFYARKTSCKSWQRGTIGHYPNELKRRKNNKLIENLGSSYYFKLSEEEALDLVLKDNKGIVI